MDEKELARGFIDNFRKNLNIASLYSKDHPAFLEACKDIKKTIDYTFNFLNSIKVGVASDYLLCEKIKFSEEPYAVLAKKLHLYRIKNIEIKKNITLEELIFFLNSISIPFREAIKRSIAAQVIKEKIGHLYIEEIDYWELLKTERGGYYKDIWFYLLSEAVKSSDYYKISQVADTFGEIPEYFSVKEILENNELFENIQSFLGYLKDKNKDKFSRVFKDVAKYIFNPTHVFSQPEIEKIKRLFNSFTESDFADILTGEILNTGKFDTFSFDLFFQLLDVDKHAAIASLIVKYLRENLIGDKQKIQDKIEKFLKISDKYHISKVYRDAFCSFLKEISSAKIISFDRELAYANYRLILLHLFLEETNEGFLSPIIKEIFKEFKNIIQNNMEVGYFKLFLDTLEKKKAGYLQAMPLFFEGLDREITDFVESNVWDSPVPEDFRYLADYPKASLLGADTYIKNIFVDNRVNATALKLFFKFFPESLNLFCKNLEDRSSDIEFIDKLIAILKITNNALALGILKQIYLSSNAFIKKVVLTAMQGFDRFDKEFLLSVLRGDDIFPKREALLILKKNEEAKKEALEALFLIKSPWGTKNGILLYNITVVEEAGLLMEAKGHLVAISKKHFFWNRNIRRRAKEILNKWKP